MGSTLHDDEVPRVLVVGATGYIGKHIAAACVECGYRTFLLLRPGVASNLAKVQQLMSLKRSGATFLKGSLEDFDNMVAILKQVDIVISSVAEDKLLEQLKLIEAMKQAGNIKRFLPSEFGMDPDHLTNCPSPGGDIFVTKREVRRAVEKSGIPYTFVSANCLNGYFLSGFSQLTQFLPPSDNVFIYGDGNQKVIWNLEKDVGHYVAKSMVDPRVINTTIYIRPPANILSLNEVVRIWEKKLGKVLGKTFVSGATWLKQIEDCPTLWLKIVMQHFYQIYYLGKLYDFNVPSNREASQLYPEIKYTTPGQYLNDFLD